MVDLASYHSITDHLIARIPEISFILSSTFMIFAGDYLLGNVFVRSLKKMDFISRTLVFVVIGLILFPALTTLSAFILRELVLKPFEDWIILVLVITFLIVGILLSLRYNMKIRLKVK